ncbi:FATTY ACID HYDROXYLASE [Salix koriyanagi]|uniref:FATTY ACID HYDROXYLASE n=1 Tax=Salix koriyanagi TaxID=2511006 RepID=A0A9Q1AMF5_9ROSI|nr:FATTY ACID HYDROXYLASE [Salix koriyanagi]
MVAQEFTVDLDKPLVFQVGHLGEAYEEWVHQPIVSREGPRFFENEFVESLTRTVWWAIPSIWLPVVCYCVLNYWGNTLHYLLHGCHHKHPMDGLRLVFPPAATAILLVPFWNMVLLFASPSITPALFGGGLLGYVMYDCTHYYLHHGHPGNDVPKNLKKYHMNHHSGSKIRDSNHFFVVGQSFWNTSSIKNGNENVDNVIESIELHPARVNVEGLKFNFLCS